MTRWKLLIEYDGAPFVGWQRQENGLSVQEALERAVGRFCGLEVAVQGAGRTDAGVHALGQVAHLDLEGRHDARTICNALNFHLKPLPVTVLQATPVAADFHARFDAVERSYLYRISDRAAPPALECGRVWHVRRPLDVTAMQHAARHLLGRHDFSSFRAVACQAESPVRTLDRLTVRRQGTEIHLTVVARSFLHRQVRIITGTLKLVGEGRWSVNDVTAALAARDRRAAGPSAPPQGLYLMSVAYPGDKTDISDVGPQAGEGKSAM